jgi:glutaredoxin 3
LNEPFHVVELDELTNGYALQDELLALTGQYTVPNIFINGQHIGGYDDLSASLATGQLVKILGK